MKLIERIPYGLVACRINGEQATVTAVSDRFLRVRLFENVEVKDLRVYFLRIKRADWIKVEPKGWKITRCERARYGFEVLFDIDDSGYTRQIYRVLSEYADYIRLKAEGDDDALTAAITGHVADEYTSPTLAVQKQKWFSGFESYEVARGYSLALSIDRPEMYDLFLRLSFREFKEDFLRRSFLYGHPLFSSEVRRVYIGNPCCFRLFPRNIAALCRRSAELGLQATIVLPPIRENRRADIDSLLEIFAACHADEIVANDWGTLTLLTGIGKSVVLGQQLDRRRKDPRMSLKTGYERDKRLLSENSLNDPDFEKFLSKYNVRRFEYEACTTPVKAVPGHHSLHLPFFQTNTSHACPLASACEGSDPGAPRDERDCAMPCLSHALMYPDSLGLVGRYNSLFGVNMQIIIDPSELDKWLCQGVDRIVAELL